MATLQTLKFVPSASYWRSRGVEASSGAAETFIVSVQPRWVDHSPLLSVAHSVSVVGVDNISITRQFRPIPVLVSSFPSCSAPRTPRQQPSEWLPSETRSASACSRHPRRRRRSYVLSLGDVLKLRSQLRNCAVSAPTRKHHLVGVDACWKLLL